MDTTMTGNNSLAAKAGKWIFGIQRASTKTAFSKVVEKSQQNPHPTFPGVMYMDGNIAPDYFMTLDGAEVVSTLTPPHIEADGASNKTVLRIGADHQFLFHNTIPGVILTILVRALCCCYEVECVKGADGKRRGVIHLRVLGLTMPREVLEGTIESTANPHQFNRVTTGLSNFAYTLRRVFSKVNGETLEMTAAKPVFDLQDYVWTGTANHSLVDLPGRCIERGVLAIRRRLHL